MKMQHFDMESTGFERGSLLYISIKKSFLTFFPIFAYISFSVIDNIVPFHMDAHIYTLPLFIKLDTSSEYGECSGDCGNKGTDLTAIFDEISN